MVGMGKEGRRSTAPGGEADYVEVTWTTRASPALPVSQTIEKARMPYQATALERPKSLGMAARSSGDIASAMTTASSPKTTPVPRTEEAPALVKAFEWFVSMKRIDSRRPISELYFTSGEVYLCPLC